MNTLDKIFTNHGGFFRPPFAIAPVGRSDHYCIVLKPRCHNVLPSNREIVCRRDLNASTLDLIGLELAKINWSRMYLTNDVQLQTVFLKTNNG